jgi:hypothetical protein
VCGIAFSLTEPARVATSQGCRRFGEPHVVTRTEGHWVLELDGKPALDVYADAAREPLAEDLRRAAERVLVALPRGASDAWVARRLSGFAPARRAFALPEPPRVGSRLGFALRDADLAREDLRDALGRVAPARAALYLGASDRGQALFRHAGLEAAIVAQAFAPAPIAGCSARSRSRRSAAPLHTWRMPVSSSRWTEASRLRAMSEPFHRGEEDVQRRAGLDARIVEVGRKIIRDFMPDEHRAFFAELRSSCSEASTQRTARGRRSSSARPASRRRPIHVRCASPRRRIAGDPFPRTPSSGRRSAFSASSSRRAAATA